MFVLDVEIFTHSLDMPVMTRKLSNRGGLRPLHGKSRPWNRDTIIKQRKTIKRRETVSKLVSDSFSFTKPVLYVFSENGELIEQVFLKFFFFF